MDMNEEIKAALAAATPGPWEWDLDRIIVDTDPITEVLAPMCEEEDGAPVRATNYVGKHDAILIMNAPTWLAAMVAENERLREALALCEPGVIRDGAETHAARQAWIEAQAQQAVTP